MKHAKWASIRDVSRRCMKLLPATCTPITLMSKNFLCVSEVGVESLSDAAATVIQQTFHATQSGEAQNLLRHLTVAATLALPQCCGLTSADIALACPPFRHPQGSPKESIAYVFRTEVGRNAGWEPRASTYQSRSLECVFVFLGIVSLHGLLRSKLSYFAVGFFQTFQESYGMCSRSSGLRGRCCHDLSLSSISDVAHPSHIPMPKLKRQLGYVGLTAIQRLGHAVPFMARVAVRIYAGLKPVSATNMAAKPAKANLAV